MAETDDESGDAEALEHPFSYVHSGNFPHLLASSRISLLVSTYQAGKLMVIRAGDDNKLSTLLRSYERPMGLAVRPGRIAVGTRRQVWQLHDTPDIARQLNPPGRHDACFVPRTSHVTGDFRGHEMAWVGDELWIVNTRFSCLCTLDPEYSFVPRWRPPFVSSLVAEDRCHLNGLAVAQGEAKYVTAHGRTDEQEGWRSGKANGGVLIDVPTGQIVVDGLSMPHSPRVYDGKVWLLHSGRGELAVVDADAGQVTTVTRLPGYTRGLAFHEHYAFVGLSKIRETATFGGVPIADDLENRKCGVYVVDIRNGETAAFLEFKTGCEEIFDVQILAHMQCPAVIGFHKDTVNGIFIAPPGAWNTTPENSSESD